MKTIIKNGQVFINGKFAFKDVLIEDERIKAIEDHIEDEQAKMYDATNKHVLPAFVDVHTHLREPGFEYKETIDTATKAAIAGGYQCVMAMPNVKVDTSDVESFKNYLALIKSSKHCDVVAYAPITINSKGDKLVDFKAFSAYTHLFSDDGKGVQSDEMMKQAMHQAYENQAMIVAHCEDERLLNGGYIHEGHYSSQHGHQGISSASEYEQVKRDLALVRETNCPYHICHISTKESVELLRNAKKEGLNVSGEVTPHHLILNEHHLEENGNYKMNPPLRSLFDQQALIAGLKDGTIDMIATDHAPHSDEEKNKGLKESLFGIVGLESAFSLCYSYLVRYNLLTFEQLVNAMSINPAKRFNVDVGIEVGKFANISIVNTNVEEKIDTKTWQTKSKNTPFNGFIICAKVEKCFYRGK